MKIKSIRQMILIAVNTVVIALLTTTGFTSYFTARHEMDEVFDAQLAQLAQYAKMIDQFISQFPSLPSDKLPVVVGVPDIQEDNIERASAQERRSDHRQYC